MFIQTATKQKSPAIVLPFILQECATDIYLLVYCTMVSPHIIFQLILIKFYSGCQVRRHENTFSETINILWSCHPVQVGGISIGIQVLSTSIIAVTIDVLCRGKHIEAMFLVRWKIVIFQSTAIDRMFCLFGNIRFVRWTVQQVPAEFFHMVIFESQFRISSRFQEGTKTNSLTMYFRYFRVSVSIMVVGRTMTVLTKDI